ncbi:HAD family hydrolase [Streptomyces sp. NPDC102467]|uniref:HAD family hydrolase n=1 Tax=Streptomyces sp. NPDC102467 TaxID=3366179 RepID=UPI0037FBD682
MIVRCSCRAASRAASPRWNRSTGSAGTPRTNSASSFGGSSPSLVALDIDGTLIAPGRTITTRCRAAVWRAHEAGCHVVLATGRASFEVVELARDMELPAGLSVCL